MNKIKVLLSFIVYPLAMGSYFRKALEHHPDVDLKVVGQYTGSWIPWMGGMNLPEKYCNPPDIPLPFPPNVGLVNYEYVQSQLGDWKPDLIISVDAGLNWSSKPSAYLATIATDPHALPYDHQRRISDKFFNMQLCYSEPKDIYLPYAYSVYDHYPILGDTSAPQHIGIAVPIIEKDADAVLIGMPYTHVPRAQWIEELRKHGVSVIAENGPIFDEYRALANRARIGLNWSSERDLNARFFETPAFGLPMVANRVPDANQFLQEGKHWLGFDDLRGAVEQVMYLKNHPDVAVEMGRRAHEAIKPHTYDARINQILKECGF